MTKTAFLFPGESSQSVGMMSAMAESYSLVRDTFSEASEVLGFDLWSVTSSGPEAELNKAEIKKPAMLVAGIATWRVWQQLGGTRPDFFAGHGLGEYSALVATGVMEFTDAVSIVAQRGRFMQQATPSGGGAMSCVWGLEDKLMREICSRVENGEIVSCANYNAPGLVVISGNREAVRQAGELALQAGAERVQLLPVEIPSHCRLMKPAAVRLQDALLTVHFSESSIPVIQNADVRAYPDAEQIREALARQLWQPVRWTETIMTLLESGVRRFYECGPGGVLFDFNRRIAPDTEVFALTGPENMNRALQVEKNDG
ncbi:MAG TPA: ACP S-malonyltransferase [Xanthomonadales bacterium]